MRGAFAVMLGCLVAAAAPAARSATVNCAAINPLPSAQAICSQPALLYLLAQENGTYHERMEHQPAAAQSYRRDENRFIYALVRCGSDEGCLRDTISMRREELSQQPSGPESGDPSSSSDPSQGEPQRDAAPIEQAPSSPPAPIMVAPSTFLQRRPTDAGEVAVSPIQQAAEATQQVPAPRSDSPADSLVGLLLLAAIVGVPVLVIGGNVAAAGRARRVFWEVVGEHEEALARQYLKLVQRNAYGVEDKRRWEKEIREFYSTRMGPELLARGVKWKRAQSIMGLAESALDRYAEEKARSLTLGLSFNSKMSPVDFEQFCAGVLERRGWSTDLTARSGDQGADIIARRGGVTLVVQCKLYTGPVGNKAVQEAHAAKAHVGANRAAVVCSTEFTPQARQLAATTGTELLHYTELAEI